MTRSYTLGVETNDRRREPKGDETMKATIWNVSTVNSPDDEQGCTVSFDSILDATRYLEWANQQGVWDVRMWTA